MESKKINTLNRKKIFQMIKEAQEIINTLKKQSGLTHNDLMYLSTAYGALQAARAAFESQLSSN